ncbi:MAG: hypothetical protein PF487_01320 [Bacteroidales bacterium]|jgi:hypothetical protein|nr:hypothetical protein [Bacteroidales bacterium]
MIKKIVKSYKKINKSLIKKMVFNDKETRDYVTVRLENDLQNCNIICDETNNPPDVVDKCMCIARVSWLNHNYTYVDLVFGRAKQVAKIEQITY